MSAGLTFLYPAWSSLSPSYYEFCAVVLLAPCLSDCSSDAVSHVWSISKQHHRMKFKQCRCSDTGLCWLDLQGKAQVRSESPQSGSPEPAWFDTLLSPTLLLWLVCCPFALPYSFLPLAFTRTFVLICCPCYFPPVIYSLPFLLDRCCHYKCSWIASRLRVLAKCHLVQGFCGHTSRKRVLLRIWANGWNW